MSRARVALMIVVGGVLLAPGCKRTGDKERSSGESAQPATPSPTAPSNRIDIPLPVRQNLGIAFAKVERRAVTDTLRFPGQFELLPTARREYRTPVSGRVELLVMQYQRVDVGMPLYRVDSSAWRELGEQIAAVRAKLDSMGPLRQSHRVHERSLADKVDLWKERLAQLAQLREAGGGSAAQHTEARAALNQTQAELADVMERDAELQAQEKSLEAEMRSLVGRREVLVRGGAVTDATAGTGAAGFEVRAAAPGVVENFGVTNGGLADESGLIVTVVRPELVRFRARGLQADLGRLREGLTTRVVPPRGWDGVHDEMKGVLSIGLTANAGERTVDLLTQPEPLAMWARAGVAAHLEVRLAGGEEELAVPLAAIVRDGTKPILFRRDPANADKVIRLEADVGIHDGRWIVIKSGVKEGDEVVVSGNYQLMLATSGDVSKGGHFHPDGTFHEGGD